MQKVTFITRPLSVYLMTIVCLISLLYSCSSREDDAMKEQLLRIQTLGDSLPEEALKSYKEIQPDMIEDCSRYTQIRHQLLGVRLRYKAGYPPTSPDSIISICSYMEKHGSDEDKIESYYYMGTVYWELNDYPQAVENCLKASQLIEAGVPGNKIIGRTICNTYSLLAYLYTELRIYKDALKAAKREYDYAKQYQILDPNIICYLAATYKANNKYTEATEYYNQAVDMIEREGSLVKYADVLANALHFFSISRDKKRAERTLAILSKLPESEKPYNYIGALSDYAVEFNISGLIETTLLEVIKDETNSPDVTQALYNLTKFYYDKGDYKRCAEYAMKFRETEELSIEERAQEESLIAHGNQIYNLNRDEQIKQLKDSETQKRNLLYITIGCTLILVCGGYYSLRKNKRLLSKTALYRTQIKTVKESLAQQEHNMSTLSAQIKDTKQENDNLKEENLKIRVKVSELELKTEHYERLLSNLPSGENRKTFFEIANKFADIAQKNKTPNDEDWRLLYASINKEFPDFAPKVEHADMRHNLPITQTCYLLKIGMTNQQIMILTDTPRQTVSNRVKRIKSLIGDYL